MATLREYFQTDFNRVLNSAQQLQVSDDHGITEITVRVHFDFDSNAKFLSCYLPADVCRPDVMSAMLAGVERWLSDANGLEVYASGHGDAPRSSTGLRFAGRFFMYHEAELDGAALAALSSDAGSQDLSVMFRGPAYAAERAKWERPLAFISHDSRDAASIARPIAFGLIRLMCPVWFDEFSLAVGVSLRESIERGLREARKCVLVVTPNFLSNPGWTKTEFNAIFTRELVEQANVILPVWSDVTPREVYEYSPVLADRVAVNWNLGVDEVVRRLRRAVDA